MKCVLPSVFIFCTGNLKMNLKPKVEMYLLGESMVKWNLCEILYLVLLMSIFNLEILKEKPRKSKIIMPHLKFSKKCFYDK
jgi:hypothetical protein